MYVSYQQQNRKIVIYLYSFPINKYYTSVVSFDKINNLFRDVYVSCHVSTLDYMFIFLNLGMKILWRFNPMSDVHHNNMQPDTLRKGIRNENSSLKD